MQRGRGLYRLLAGAHFYLWFQNFLATARSIWVDIRQSHLGQLPENPRVLDIGCGPGTFLVQGHLVVKESDFTGIDPSADYIESARDNFPGAHFHLGTVSDVTLPSNHFDLVVLGGVLHHLDDQSADQALAFARDKLKPGGLAISVDPVLFRGQNAIAWVLAKLDRGMFVRHLGEMKQRWLSSWPDDSVSYEIQHDYLRLPYNHIVVVGKK
ncbi:MAG: class I SAM-dependent methyltransferase [Verrucomicrobia bacterium]|jgi:SAM-dependent methyltransferase|nr:class I SAM-dependent methyltransferase [Verrucomicrobiota bacterium]